MEELILSIPHFKTLGKSGDPSKPEWVAYSLISTGGGGTVAGYGSTPTEALTNLQAELEKHKVVVTVEVANEYRIV